MENQRLRLPRRQRARQLELMIFWHNETPAEFRREFGNDYFIFEQYVWRESERLIESAET